MDEKYTITLNRNQAYYLTWAMDLYTRMGLGQLEELANVLPLSHPTLRMPCDELRDDLQALKQKHLGLAPNASRGIGHSNLSEAAQVVHDIESVLRGAIAKVENHHGSSVWHNPPLKLGKEPIAEVKVEQ